MATVTPRDELANTDFDQWLVNAPAPEVLDRNAEFEAWLETADATEVIGHLVEDATEDAGDRPEGWGWSDCVDDREPESEAPAPTGEYASGDRRLGLAEWIEAEAFAYHVTGAAASVWLAKRLFLLAQEVKDLHANTIEEFEGRDEVMQRGKLEERSERLGKSFDRGYALGRQHAAW